MTGATPAGHQEGGCGSFYAKIQVIWGAAAGKTGGCRKTYRDDGSYIAGCYQGSGAGT